MDDLPDAPARFAARLEELERRVSALEHLSEISSPLPAQEISAAGAAQTAKVLPFVQAGGTFSVVGKALLGIAGAYLLRAVAESGSFPKLAVIALALAYAGMWLVWAARAPAGAWFASITYASTSALVLAPMLWELTLRFNVLPTPVTAGTLVTFVIAASALAWKRNLTSVAWVANFTAIFLAIALLAATHDVAPFTAAILLMALLGEYAAGHNHWPSVRSMLAAAADLAIWSLIYIYSNHESVHIGHKGVSPAMLLVSGPALFFIYGVSVVIQTVLLRKKITFFDAGQTVIAFLLAAVSVLFLGPSVGAIVLGAFCLLFSAAGYAVVFVRPGSTLERRNYHVYATWSAALFLGGGFLCLPPLWLTLWLGMAAIAATFLGVRAARQTLKYHGVVYLAVAAYISGLLHYASHALVGTVPVTPAWIVWAVTASAVLCYALGGGIREEQKKQRPLQLIPAALAIGAIVALLVSALARLTAFSTPPSTPHLAFIRTLTICAVALALVFSGSRWQRTELVWIAYGALALVAARLMFVDLLQGHPGSIAASICLFAVTLMVLPRLTRIGQRV